MESVAAADSAQFEGGEPVRGTVGNLEAGLGLTTGLISQTHMKHDNKEHNSPGFGHISSCTACATLLLGLFDIFNETKITPFG